MEGIVIAVGILAVVLFFYLVCILFRGDKK